MKKVSTDYGIHLPDEDGLAEIEMGRGSSGREWLSMYWLHDEITIFFGGDKARKDFVVQMFLAIEKDIEKYAAAIEEERERVFMNKAEDRAVDREIALLRAEPQLKEDG